MKKDSLFLVLFSFILISCNQPNQKVVEALFNVNKALLSDSAFISKTGFNIYPPRYWSLTETYNSELQNRTLHRSDNKLLAVYKCDTSNCALIISELPEANYQLIKQFTNEQNPDSVQDSLWTNVQTSVFKYKTYELIQIVSQNSEMINFKLYAHRLSELYELDYIIPRSEINSNMQCIESSIGSLN